MTKARIQEFVIADSIRNPECAWHWMPDRVRHDKPRKFMLSSVNL
jgi:hypothetical protein